MMRVATQIAPLYPGLNLDLLVTGILFHDAGKLWENYLPETGFSMPFDELGEMVGHIGIGLEVVNSLWRKIQTGERAAEWQKISPPMEDCRLHLLHLIASHHGEPQFGSPVYPKTPEALALNYIDNLDARLEMILAGYPVAKPLAARIFERVRPLPGNLVKPLEKFSPEVIRRLASAKYSSSISNPTKLERFHVASHLQVPHFARDDKQSTRYKLRRCRTNLRNSGSPIANSLRGCSSAPANSHRTN